MGIEYSIAHDKFPKQGDYLGKPVRVCFHYDTSNIIDGEVVRDDIEDPGLMIIKLSTGNYVLSTECQWSPVHVTKVNFNLTETFTTRMIRQPDGVDIGEHKGTVTVKVEEGGGCSAEFSIDSLNYYADIGLRIERTAAGLELMDFDGTHCLPIQITHILRANGVIVGKDFE